MKGVIGLISLVRAWVDCRCTQSGGDESCASFGRQVERASLETVGIQGGRGVSLVYSHEIGLELRLRTAY